MLSTVPSSRRWYEPGAFIEIKTARGRIQLRRSTIHEYLPGIARFSGLAASSIVPYHLDMLKYAEFRGRCKQRCLWHLLMHLKTVEEYGSRATTLVHWLEGLLDLERPVRGLSYSRGSLSEVTKCFDALCTLMNPYLLGCNRTLFDEMSRFVLANSAKLGLLFTHYELSKYILALGRVGRSICPVIRTLRSRCDDPFQFDRMLHCLVRDPRVSSRAKQEIEDMEPEYLAMSPSASRALVCPPPPYTALDVTRKSHAAGSAMVRCPRAELRRMAERTVCRCRLSSALPFHPRRARLTSGLGTSNYDSRRHQPSWDGPPLTYVPQCHNRGVGGGLCDYGNRDYNRNIQFDVGDYSDEDFEPDEFDDDMPDRPYGVRGIGYHRRPGYDGDGGSIGRSSSTILSSSSIDDVSYVTDSDRLSLSDFGPSLGRRRSDSLLGRQRFSNGIKCTW
ncbi:MAG: hypothetical protein M1825_000904 [Sarcosagium campestre]|nr:MAG: hypothetical protein M1825_000904 [Sarcosagium campestre]